VNTPLAYKRDLLTTTIVLQIIENWHHGLLSE
jgi:hypothetical protein